MRDSIKVGIICGLAAFVGCFSIFYAYEPMLEKGIKSQNMPAWLQAFGSVVGLFVAFWIGRSDTVARKNERNERLAFARLEADLIIQQNLEQFVSARVFVKNVVSVKNPEASISRRIQKFRNEYEKLAPPSGEVLREISAGYGHDVLRFHRGLVSLKYWNSQSERIINKDVLHNLVHLSPENASDNRALNHVERKLQMCLLRIVDAIEDVEAGGLMLWRVVDQYPFAK